MQFQSGQEDHWAGADHVDASDNFSVGQMGRMGRMGQISQMDIGGASGLASQGRPLVMPARSQARSSYPQNHSLYAMPEPSTNRYVPMPLDQQDHQDPQDPLGPATGMGQGPSQDCDQGVAGPLDHHLPVAERILQHATLVLQTSAELDQHLGGQGPQLYSASGAYHSGQPHQLHQPHPSNGQGPVAKDRYSQVHAQLEGAVQQLGRCTPSGAGLTGQPKQTNQTSKTRGLVRPGQRANGFSGVGGYGGYSGYGGSGTPSRFDKLCQEVLRTKQKLWQADLQMLCRAVPCRSWATHSAVGPAGPAGPANPTSPPDPKRARSSGGEWNVMDSDDGAIGPIGPVIERLETQAREAAGLAENAVLELDKMHVSNADILDTYGSEDGTNLSTLLGHLASAAVDNEMDSFATTHTHMQEAIEFLQEQVHALQDPNLIGVKNLAIAIAHLNKAPVSTFMSTDCEQLVYDTLERATRMLSTLKEKFEQVDRSFIEAHEAIQIDVEQKPEPKNTSGARMFGRSRFSGPELKNGTINPAKDWMTFEQYHVEHTKQVEHRRLEILMALFRVTDPAAAKDTKQPGRNGDTTLGTTLSATPTWETRMASLVNLIEANEDAVLSCIGEQWSINQDWVKALAAKINPNYLATLLQLLPEYGMTQHLWDVYRTHVFGYSQQWLMDFEQTFESDGTGIVEAHDKLYTHIHRFWNSFHSWCQDSVWVHKRNDVMDRISRLLKAKETIDSVINPWISRYYKMRGKYEDQIKTLDELNIEIANIKTQMKENNAIFEQGKMILDDIEELMGKITSVFDSKDRDVAFDNFENCILEKGFEKDSDDSFFVNMWKFAVQQRIGEKRQFGGVTDSRRKMWQNGFQQIVSDIIDLKSLVGVFLQQVSVSLPAGIPSDLQASRDKITSEMNKLGEIENDWVTLRDDTTKLNNLFDEINTDTAKIFRFSFDADILDGAFTEANFRQFIQNYLVITHNQRVDKLKQQARDKSTSSVKSLASAATNLVFSVAAYVAPDLLKQEVDDMKADLRSTEDAQDIPTVTVTDRFTKYINGLIGWDIDALGQSDSSDVSSNLAMPTSDFPDYCENLKTQMTSFWNQLSNSYKNHKDTGKEWPQTDNLFESVQAMAKQAWANGYISDVCTSYTTFFVRDDPEEKKDIMACIWDKARDAYWMLVNIVEMSNQGIRLEGHIRAQIDQDSLMHSSEILNNLKDMSVFNRYEATDGADTSGLFKSFFFDVALAKVFSTTNEDSVKYMTKLQSMVYENMELRDDYLQENEIFTQAMYAQAFAILCGLTLKLLFDMIKHRKIREITEVHLLLRVQNGEFFELCLEAMKHSGNSVTEIIRPLVANRALLMNIEKATPDVFTGGSFGYQEHSLALLRQYNLSKWAADVMGDLGRFQGPDPCMPQAIVSLLQNMVFQKQHHVMPFERQVLPLFDAGGMIRSAIDQMYIVSLAQEVFSDLLNKHPQLRHPQMALEVMYTEKYNDFYAEFVQLVNMQEQLTKRYAGTKVTYAQDARAVAQRYRTMCFVFKHAKVTVMGQAGVAGPVYLLDSRVPVAPNRTETGEGPLACHTCEMLVRGNLMASYRAKREQERRIHQQDVDWQKTHLREMQVLGKELQKAKVDYQVARTNKEESANRRADEKQEWEKELHEFKVREATHRVEAMQLKYEQKMDEVARTNKNMDSNKEQRDALIAKFNVFRKEINDKRNKLSATTDEESKMLKAELDVMLKQQEQITKLLSSNPKQWFR